MGSQANDGLDDERVVVVDAEDRPVGSMGKLTVHRENIRHRAISVLIFDRIGRMLLQRRSVSKYHSGGLWSNACCSHPWPGEIPAAAAARRLREEMGIVAPLGFAGRFSYEAAVGDGLCENEVVHVFVGRYDGAVAPDAEEAEAFSWQFPDAILKDLSVRPDRYTAWFRLYSRETWFSGAPTRSAPAFHRWNNLPE
jgi:isopentenyl-diphosphate Delta-isomerase